ncbi:hypothetical protein HGRIS_013021 [Hohenbuehelia grisea]|uniref:D-lactate dehydratase n=1 Tax=Hohenbuehelia grisea TaxID=104357 RepID=A0ABR3IUD3_9AGAR
MSSKILFVFTSANKTLTGTQTGWYLPEAAHPYYILAPHFTIDFAAPAGPNPPLDQGSVEAFKEDKDSVKFLDDDAVKSKLASAKKLTEVNVSDYVAVFYPGGHGPVLDLPEDPVNVKLVSDFYQAGKIVSAVCHGPAALVGALIEQNHSTRTLIAGGSATATTMSDDAPSPIAILSDDELMHIFNACYPTHIQPRHFLDNSDDKEYSRDTVKTLFSLTHVCRFWRKIAVDFMPHLWSIINISDPETSIAIPHLDQVDLFLRRSDALPLHIRIFDEGSTGKIYALLSLLIPHRARCRTLRIESGTHIHDLSIFEGMDFDVLEAVNIRLTGQRTPLHLAAFRSPNLRHIIWSYPIHGINDLYLPPQGITCLVMDKPYPVRDLVFILGACRQLIEVTCLVDDDIDDAHLHRPRIVLQHLRKLDVMFECESLPFCDTLTLPALTHFKMKYFYYEHPPPLQSLTNLLVRSQCKLDQFELIVTAKEPDSLLSAAFRLPAMQSVKMLHINCTVIPDLLVPTLATCIPKLQELRVEYDSFMTERALQKTFARMVLARYLHSVSGDTERTKRIRDVDPDDFGAVADILAGHGTRLDRRDMVSSQFEWAFYSCSNLPAHTGDLDELVTASEVWWKDVVSSDNMGMRYDHPLVERAYSFLGQ